MATRCSWRTSGRGRRAGRSGADDRSGVAAAGRDPRPGPGGPVGSYCGRLLADAGADVVKVELPAGDELRRQGPFAGGRSDPERSLTFAYYQANKRGIVLDYRRAEALGVLAELGANADVVLPDPAGGGLRSEDTRAVLGRAGASRLRGHAVRADRPLPHLARHPPHLLRAGRRDVLAGTARRSADRDAGPPAL